MTGKKVPAYKKESTNLIKIICQLVFFLSSVKSLIGLYSILYLITLWKTNFLQSVSQVLYLVTHAWHNCCQFIHEIYVSFDCNPSAETRGIFLDISKVFDKVWHEGLIFKLKACGIDDDLLELLNYLEDRKQRVVLNGQTSSWKNILAGVPQGSVLGPILFLIYINDLPDGIKLICKIFADYTLLFSKVKDNNYSTVELKMI